MIIIGCAGLAKAGKTTLCELIEKEIRKGSYRLEVFRWSMAGRLRIGLKVLGVTKEKTPDLYRKMAQSIGTDMLRNPKYSEESDTDWWVNLVRQDFKDIAEGVENIQEIIGQKRSPDDVVILVDDVRFPNEVSLIKSWGGLVLFVDRCDELPEPDAPWRDHISEQMAYEYMDLTLPDEFFDETVISAGTIEDMNVIVLDRLKDWLKPVLPA